MGVRVGVDLVHADEVASSMAEFGDRYLARVYTADEVADCSTDGVVDATRLAARFAAKEATIKVLRDGVAWSAIGVRRQPSGHVELELTGPARRLADLQGLSDFSVSLTHDRGVAAAVVAASVEATRS